MLSEASVRIIFAVVAIPVVLFIVINGGNDHVPIFTWLFRAFVIGVLAGGVIEFWRMTREKGTPIFLPAALVGVALFGLRGLTAADIDAAGAFGLFQTVFFPGMFIALFLVICAEVLRAQPEQAIARAGGTVLAIFYIGFLGSYLIIIPQQLFSFSAGGMQVSAKMGGSALIMLFAAVWGSDTFAYGSGRLFGSRLLWPRLSPKKTVEGLAGSVFGGMVGMCIGRTLFEPAFPSLPAALCIGAVIGVLGQAGDLFESLLKRSCGVKDSSHLLPGHGGILDRIDALIFCAPIYYYLMKAVQWL
ncbi:MAG: hypothetical protein A2268_11495 [Candidatus Raymondbacteria bacterium RifOxyA12_full_50_37]|uniref:Phosphatidate cytidylyltransferase n=1 Tax=Candidatus Raymondbacteria bacterium RIFOXYD12_FULL_49_13 TaxID=1817890 RepID=A0A1F7FAF4_UNCRA|nr:MAG: hypothetical protein A2268_11495 [Candidatus Raymondbacteria bacterium RifOxyA12_full_50_37]OGJ92392.1 MAG: hypothetical protein A2248_10620 [Candidatus Raymondbacteria bacterium RIFOXYA2_FULL_49_16]OGJ98759.1 MAG: hypothetical protein A2350_00510 [Candidatus Raymondbacteria bacterium RifOxyB12_full_50_8]OGJ99373.1 MAG: hypothetical protein A2453_13680 [Candidatus Raymondbacteria bacterium RIFOXYC2_FULL_50_21]OGK03613.1 MAG: hypothetical protein A2519_02440 [Candidatus Raymondbacteria b